MGGTITKLAEKDNEQYNSESKENLTSEQIENLSSKLLSINETLENNEITNELVQTTDSIEKQLSKYQGNKNVSSELSSLLELFKKVKNNRKKIEAELTKAEKNISKNIDKIKIEIEQLNVFDNEKEIPIILNNLNMKKERIERIKISSDINNYNDKKLSKLQNINNLIAKLNNKVTVRKNLKELEIEEGIKNFRSSVNSCTSLEEIKNNIDNLYNKMTKKFLTETSTRHSIDIKRPELLNSKRDENKSIEKTYVISTEVECNGEIKTDLQLKSLSATETLKQRPKPNVDSTLTNETNILGSKTNQIKPKEKINGKILEVGNNDQIKTTDQTDVQLNMIERSTELSKQKLELNIFEIGDCRLAERSIHDILSTDDMKKTVGNYKPKISDKRKFDDDNVLTDELSQKYHKNKIMDRTYQHIKDVEIVGEKIELHITKIKNKVNQFFGVPTDTDYLKLKTELEDILKTLTAMETNRNNDKKNILRNLTTDVKTIYKNLQDKSYNMESIQNYETKLRALEQKFETNINSMTDYEKEDNEDELRQIKEDLERTTVIDEVISKKQECLKKIQTLFLILQNDN